MNKDYGKLALAGAFLAMGVATAAAGGASNSGTQSIDLGQEVDAPNVRYAVFYDRGEIVRQKNVQKVEKISTGIYCIKLKKYNGVKPDAGELMPSVTVEWGSSNDDDLLAYWQASSSSCKNSSVWVQVRTYDFEGGTTNESDDVSFVMTIP